MKTAPTVPVISRASVSGFIVYSLHHEPHWLKYEPIILMKILLNSSGIFHEVYISWSVREVHHGSIYTSESQYR